MSVPIETTPLVEQFVGEVIAEQARWPPHLGFEVSGGTGQNGDLRNVPYRTADRRDRATLRGSNEDA